MRPAYTLRPHRPPVDNTSELNRALSSIQAAQANVAALTNQLAALKEAHEALKGQHNTLKADVTALKAEVAALKASVPGPTQFIVSLDEVAIILSHRLFRASLEGDNGVELWALCARLQPLGLRAALHALAKLELMQPTPQQLVMLEQFL